MWWIKADYPDWNLRYDAPTILEEIYESNRERWAIEPVAT